jgi:hypothetical protein
MQPVAPKPESNLASPANTDRRRFSMLLAAAAAGATGFAQSASADDLAAALYRHGRDLKFDAAENMARFVWDTPPVDANKPPLYGSPFITEGYIYPYGTLTGNTPTTPGNGVLANGDAEFPNLVIGRWTCRGWFVGDGAATKTGPLVITHQLFDLGRKPGEMTLCTDGVELVDVNVPVLRAITGGTGRYVNAGGQVEQVFLGTNVTLGVNLRFVFDVRRR